MWSVSQVIKKFMICLWFTGCWQIPEGKECQPSSCISDLPPRQNNTHFCCCSGYMCNVRFMDVYNPPKHTTTTAQAAHVAFGMLVFVWHFLEKQCFLLVMLVWSCHGLYMSITHIYTHVWNWWCGVEMHTLIPTLKCYAVICQWHIHIHAQRSITFFLLMCHKFVCLPVKKK